MRFLAYTQSRSSSTAKQAVQLLSLAVALLLGSLPAFSQGSEGAINGGVFDSTGAVIAGAKVTLTDPARGFVRTLTTDGAGEYTAPNLAAGTYTVRAEATGFRTTERNNVLLQVGENVRIDLTLSPGEQTQTITVTGEAPTVDTTSSTLGGAVSNQSIVEMPLNGRNFMRLLDLRPGVVSAPGASTASESTNGRRLGGDNLVVEGLVATDPATANYLLNGPGKGGFSDASNELPIDAIQEFNTQQNPTAEFGWKDGSVINVGVKSGTNSIHGSAYAFGRDAAATDSKNFFTQTVNPATLEQFGGTAGGPVLKNKVFWFAAFEGLRLNVNSTSQSIIASDVSTGNPALSMVDACNAVKSGAAGGTTTINPLSAQLAGLNAATCTVSPASSSLENVFPYNPTATTSVYFGSPSSQPLNNGLAKGDWNINDRHHVSVYFYDSESTAFTGGAIQPYWDTLGIGRANELSGGWTWTPNSSWLNNLRLGWVGATGIVTPGDVNSLPVNPWPSGYSMNTGVTNPEFGGFPSITFSSGLTSLGVGGRPGRRGPTRMYNFTDTVSYLRGRHTIKFGPQWVYVRYDDADTVNMSGTIPFASLETFLQGTPLGGGSIITGDPERDARWNWFAGFIDDTWRVTPRLTLTPGLRYEYQPPPHAPEGVVLGEFDPSAVGGMAQVGSCAGCISELYHAQRANFLPRFGLAWDIRGDAKTVLRAGVGELVSTPSIPTLAQSSEVGATLINAAGQIVVDNRTTTLGQEALNTLNFTAPQLAAGWNTTGPIFPISSATGPTCSATTPCTTGTVDPNFKNPKSLQWNVDIQRALGKATSFDLAYVGIHGFDEFYSRDLNNVPIGTGWDPATIAKCLASASACVVNSAAIVAARPYNAEFPYYSYIVESTSGMKSNYNALQLTVDQRVFHGVSFLAAYTYSHALDMFSAGSSGTRMQADPNNLSQSYGTSDQDIRHRFRFSPVWAIPGKKTPAWAGQMLQGWSVSAVVALQSGLPWTALDSTKNDFIGTGENLNAFTTNTGVQQFWNYSGPTSAFSSGDTAIPCYGKLGGCTAFASAPASVQSACQGAAQAPYLGNATLMALALQALANNACYIQNGGVLTPPAYGTNGDAGRNIFRGPGFYNADLTIAKSWHIGERLGAEFRTEFFNVTNTPTIGLPGGGSSGESSGSSPVSPATFGFSRTTADGTNNVFGSGGPRHIQFGLKFTF